MFTTKLEEELFSDIERFSPLAIAIQHALLALAVLYRLLNQDADGKLKDLKPLCQAFEEVVLSLGPMKAKIGACDPYHFPAMAFMEFSQALHYVMRLVRKLLPPFVSDDPILGLLHKLEEMKDWCRPEKRPENTTEEQFRKGIEEAFEGMIEFARKIAVKVHCYDAELRTMRPPTPTDAALTRIEMTAEDTNETAHRLDSRDRRHRSEAGKGGQLGANTQKRVKDLWDKCQENPGWFGDAAKIRRVTKRMAYDYLVGHALLPPLIDSFKTFCRALDSARKH